jgi:hypothetical protein
MPRSIAVIRKANYSTYGVQLKKCLKLLFQFNFSFIKLHI